eukprot:8715208-Alexandrium_andersonii.AAC.1
MSASLVGSEMCIRDSRPSGRGCGVSALPEGRRGPLKKTRQSAQSVGAPVSYTHLTLPTICSV